MYEHFHSAHKIEHVLYKVLFERILMQVLCLVQVGSGQLCSWVASNLTWAAGARLELSISNIQQVLGVVATWLLLLVVMCFGLADLNSIVG